MFGISFWKYLSLMTIVIGWARQALQDRKITRKEALQLVDLMGAALGVETLFEIPPDDD